MRPLKILTWHVHGSYLLYLTQVPCEFYLPFNTARSAGYGGRCGSNPWKTNLHEIPVDQVRNESFDCIIYQSRDHYFKDQYEILSDSQRRLPRIYIEHDPPRENPILTRHPVQDTGTLLVHVTPFNALMWDSGITPTRIIDHGVFVPDDVHYTGRHPRGVVVINHLEKRGRRLGNDIFKQCASEIPLDLVGMASHEMGGLGEVPLKDLPYFEADYRFFFNPIRYTSLGLSVCEAMMVGLPIIGVATTEMATVIQNGVSGYIDTRVDRLIEHMKRLMGDPEEARQLGIGAQHYARERFSIHRFIRDWQDAIHFVVGRSSEFVGKPAVHALSTAGSVDQA